MYEQSLRQLDESEMLPWLSATALLNEHRKGDVDHTKALHALFNLHLLLEARPDLFAPNASNRNS